MPSETRSEKRRGQRQEIQARRRKAETWGVMRRVLINPWVWAGVGAGLGGGYLLFERLKPHPVGKDFPFVSLFYPEISNLEVRESGTVTTDGSSEITWANYSQLKVNETVLASIYDYFEKLSRNDLEGTTYLSGEPVPIRVVENHEPYRATVIIVPEGMVLPSTWPGREIYGRTAKDRTIKEAFTVIRVHTPSREEMSVYPNEGVFASRVAITEACHTMVNVIGPDGKVINLAQETFCISFSRALILRTAGTSFPEYQQLLTGAGYEIPGSGLIPFFVLAENQYQQLPTNIGEVFSQ